MLRDVTPPKVLITRMWPVNAIDAMRLRYDVTVDKTDRPLSRSDLISAMLTYDAVCPTITDRLAAEILNVAGARVRVLANYGAGVDHIDLQAARACGIVVTNTPDVLSEATAELAILLMMMASRRAGEGERELRAGKWTGWRPSHLVGRSLSGRTLGLVGFGRIAQIVARRARTSLGMRVMYTSRSRSGREVEEALDAVFVPSLQELAGQVDVLSLHCPGGPATQHLINRAILGRMRSTALLVNTARGSVVDETALAEALIRGGIGGAALDVYEQEPAVAAALINAPNAVLLPHLGSATGEARTAMGMRVLANLESFFHGQEPLDRVV
jgi:lactate dehydrogenase-like 2-hydroxyacid dehydrogenase